MSAVAASRQPSHPSRRTNQSVSSNASASSSRSERSRPPPNPAVESAVTRLLVSIKVLLESLTQWSKQIVDENQVSDVYVRLGNDFNSAVAAFGAFGIEMNELSSVPDDLREVLEECLSEDATPDNLERFLPRVRKIITQLLQGLRAKQSIYRRIVQDHRQRPEGSDRDSRSSRSDRVREESVPPRPSSRGPGDVPARSKTPSSRRKPSSSDNTLPPVPATNSSSDQPFVGGFAAPPVTNTLSADSDNPRQRASTPVQPRSSLSQMNSIPLPRAYSTSSADPSFPRDPRQQTNGFGSPEPPQQPPPPVQAPVPGHVKRFSLVDGPVPSVLVNDGSPMSPPPAEDVSVPGTPPTEGAPLEPPPPAVQNSLAALKKAEALERRASKRFSTYNISKMTGMRDRSGGGGGSMNGGNRRSLIATPGALTPGDLAALAEEGDTASPRKKDRARSQRTRGPSPIVEGDEPPPVPPLPPKSTSPQPGATSETTGRSTPQPSHNGEVVPSMAIATSDARVSATDSEDSTADTSGKPFPVFLQVGREVKKVVIEPGMSLGNLRLLFVDKFSYSPGQDNFPAIYIRDPSSGVQYELEDVDEVKSKVLLSLNIEPLDQIKQHIDVQISSLQQDIKDLRTAVVSNRRTSTILTQPLAESTPIAARPSEQRFRDVARRISRLIPDNSTTPIAGYSPLPPPIEPQWTGSMLQMQYTGSTLQPQMTGASVVSEYTTRVVSDLKTQFDEVQNLRRDLGIMRQLYTEFMKQTKESLGTLRQQTQTVKQLSTQKVGGARAYIDTGKAKLDTRSQNVLTRMEELQDTVENIKDDVLKRNVSPKAFVLKNVKGDIQAVAGELQSLKDHIQTVKPMWKKTWEEELQNIVEEQQFLQHQEEFLEDLFEDHKAVLEVFGHVEKVISLRGASSVKRRAPTFKPPPPTEEGQGGLSTVMMEIRTAAIDPERRLKAIAANEKNRERDMANRADEFQTELNGFVVGKKLKMTGGAEEAERVRKRRDELTLKAMFNGGSGPAGGAGTRPMSPLAGSGSGLVSPGPMSPALSQAPAGDGESGAAAGGAPATNEPDS
ncbi:actin interacting protein 3-domain-containing protein [Trametes gibbosa]|nr:actin interacting protein 3-domain-containing protein [Trametes gibbosa]